MDVLTWDKLTVAGVLLTCLVALWKFFTREIFGERGWVSKFYNVQWRQSEAMVLLASKVTENADDQRETLIVMRSLSQSLEDLHHEVNTDAERTGQVLQRLGNVEGALNKLGEGKWVGV
jgi:hypothetical protein